MCAKYSFVEHDPCIVLEDWQGKEEQSGNNTTGASNKRGRFLPR